MGGIYKNSNFKKISKNRLKFKFQKFVKNSNFKSSLKFQKSVTKFTNQSSITNIDAQHSREFWSLIVYFQINYLTFYNTVIWQITCSRGHRLFNTIVNQLLHSSLKSPKETWIWLSRTPNEKYHNRLWIENQKC